MRQLLLCTLALLLAIALVPASSRAWSNGDAAVLVLGQPDFTSNSSAPTQNTMSQPQGVAVDSVSGKVFVVETNNSRVLRFASLATLSNGANAEAVLGQPDFTSNTVATTSIRMRSPIGAAVDSSGRLWVADTGNNRVLRFDNAATKANGAAADVVLGQSTFTSNTAPNPPTQAGMNGPFSVTVDSAGRLWVADRNNHRVLRFDDAASKASGAAADGVLGQTNFTSSGSATTPDGMNLPVDVAADSAGRLWIVEPGNNRVLRFDNAASKGSGANADGVLGQTDFISGSSASTQAGMSNPFSVAVDSAGHLWISDASNNRVLRFDNAASKANGAAADGVLGQPDFVSNGLAITSSGMRFPAGVAVDSAGNLWVADSNNNRVLLFQDLPRVTITRAASSPSSAASVSFTVTFSTAVTGLSASNFALTATGTISGASISSVSGSGTSWTVTVATGSGNGTLRLDMPNSSGAQDINGNPVTNVPYTGGETFTINKTTPVKTADVSSSLSFQRVPNGIVTYTLTVRNLGPAATDGTAVTTSLPTLPAGGVWRWTCQAVSGATCSPSGTGNINALLISLPSGGAAIYTITSSVPAQNIWRFMAITVPTGITDPVPSNNIARGYGLLLPMMR